MARSDLSTTGADVANSLIELLDRVATAVAERDRTKLYTQLHKMNDFIEFQSPDLSLERIQSFARNHSTFELLLEDPYTHHAFTKPRGFAGDASLIDMFYGHGAGRYNTTESGRFIFETLMQSPSCDAVRFRRGHYGSLIDQIAAHRGEQTEVFALACGHLREVMFSRAATERRVKISGIDSDIHAVQETTRSLSNRNVLVAHKSIIEFIRHSAWNERYDLIYSAGLLDYLDDKIALRLLKSSFLALKPGGMISFANFLPTIRERGYMEIIMDWVLVYRTPLDMLSLASKLPQDQVLSIESWVDPLETVVYLTVIKKDIPC